MLINKDRKLFFLSALFFALITTIIIISWFRFGLLYGGGDVGLPSYNPLRVLEITKNIWWDAAAPGNAIPHGVSSVPFQFFQSKLQSIGLHYVLIQAISFWIILFTMFYGMFWVGYGTFKKNVKYSILVSLFYVLSFYMMIQVWHRFVHTTFFLAAALPLFYIFWKNWINKGRFLDLALFLFVNFLASFLYGTIAFVFTILLLLLSIFFYYSFIPWQGSNNLLRLCRRLIIGIVFFVLTNMWWEFSVFTVAPAVFSVQHSIGENLSNLLALSQQSIIPYILLGINPFYLYQQQDFGEIYQNYFFLTSPWLILAFIIPGFYYSLKKKEFLFWPLLLIIALFLSKGAALPFGHFFVFGFDRFFILGVLRNSYEKIGILLPFALSILSTFGFIFYINLINKRFSKNNIRLLGKSFLVAVLIVLLGVNLWPFWLGKLFGKAESPAWVSVPDSYLQADNFINLNKGNFQGRILHLPLGTGEAVNYNWEYGYNGVEPSQLLFTSLPSISHGYNLPFVDNALSATSNIFRYAKRSDPTILKLMQVFNTQFIVLHKDVRWEGGFLDDPKKLEEVLDTQEFLTKKKQFNDLIVYKLKPEFLKPRIYFLDSFNYLSSGFESSFWPWIINKDQNDLVTPLSDSDLSNYTNIVISPQEIINYHPSLSTYESAIQGLPSVRFLPTSPLYFLIKIKERLVLANSIGEDKFANQLIQAGKRLVEADKLKKNVEDISIESLIDSYKAVIPNLIKGIEDREGKGLSGGQIALESVFARHLVILDHLYQVSQPKDRVIIQETKDELMKGLVNTHIFPQFSLKDSSFLSQNNRVIERLELPASGDYEILQATKIDSANIYPSLDKGITLQIDNQVEELLRRSDTDERIISYGTKFFDKGVHEISFYATSSANLIPTQEIIETKGDVILNNRVVEINSSQHDNSLIRIPINPLAGDAWYVIEFEAWIKKGNEFLVRVIQDTDPEDPDKKDEKLYTFNKPINRNPYSNVWNSFSFNAYIRPATTQAWLEIIIEPWDDCAAVLGHIKELCESKEFRFPFEHPSSVEFKNLSIKKQLNELIFLRTNNNRKLKKSENRVEFTQINPILYEGKINVVEPGIVFLGVSFHPDWKITLNDDKNSYVYSPEYLVNMYGNGFYMDKVGEYSFKAEFVPHKGVSLGVTISLVSAVVLILFIVKKKYV